MKSKERKSGDRFGKLTIVKELEGRKDSEGRFRRWFLFQCDCGLEKEKQGTEVFYGNTVSCGCYRREVISRGRISDRKDAAVRKLYRSYKAGANRRKLIWKLTKSQFESLIFSPCYYTNRKPSRLIRIPFGCFQYNGIDRLNNSLGYTFENCVPCCTEVNAAKSNLSKDDFLTIVKEVYENSVRLKSTARLSSRTPRETGSREACRVRRSNQGDAQSP